jgi:hypothetical protein
MVLVGDVEDHLLISRSGRRTPLQTGNTSVLGHTYGLTMTLDPSFQPGSRSRGSTGTLQQRYDVVVLIEKLFEQASPKP